MSVETTSSQTVGPYLHIGLTWLVTDDLVGPGTTGTPIVIEGRVIDADGKPVDDALIEIWQANAHGRYDHPEDTRDLPLEDGFKGFGRVATDAGGAFRFRTIKPGPVPAPGGGSSAAGPSQGASSDPSGGSEAATAAGGGALPMQAAHINVTIFMRGMLKQLSTRIYFPDEPANASDPVLQSVPAERRGTLVAKRVADGVLRWDVVLQGAGETVFFEF